MAYTENFLKGVTDSGEGDARVTYLSPEDFKAQFGDQAGAATTGADGRPEIFINLDSPPNRTLYHEIYHGLEKLEGMQPKLVELRQKLFTRTFGGGAEIKGLYSADEVGRFRQQYLERLDEGIRSKHEILEPDTRETSQSHR